MKWSRYSKLFESKRNGWFLYNSYSNSFFKIAPQQLDLVTEIKNNPNQAGLMNKKIYQTMLKNNIVVQDDDDDKFVNVISMERIKERYSNDTLRIFIAPSLQCNFACSYCFENGYRDNSVMTPETMDNVVNFIKKHQTVNQIYVSWYGGEPLMSIKQIEIMTEKIKNLGKDYHASIGTNGYLLTPSIINKLEDLRVDKFVITIDGSRDDHNQIRYLANGQGSFDRIINNIDNLLNSGWSGLVVIRFNIDRSETTVVEQNKFRKIWKFLHNHYSSEQLKQIDLHPGFIYNNDNDNVDNFKFSKADFIKDLASEGINSLPIFPRKEIFSCVLFNRFSYAIGSFGEVYNCLFNLGNKEKAIGSVNSDLISEWYYPEIARQMTRNNSINDPECQNCFYFPICNIDWTCQMSRQKNKAEHRKNSICTYFRDSLEDLLEIYYEQNLLKIKVDEVLS